MQTQINTLDTTTGEEQGFIDTLQSEMRTIQGEMRTIQGGMQTTQGEMIVVEDALGLVSAETFAASFSSTMQNLFNSVTGSGAV